MKKREMVLEGKKVTFDEAEQDEITFWADSTWIERLAEAERLRKIIWTHILGKYPEKIEVTGAFINKSKIP